MVHFYLLLTVTIGYNVNAYYSGPTIGVVSSCDWAKPATDWNENDTSTYTCPGPHWPAPQTGDVKLYVIPNFDPTKDKGMRHVCLNETITYAENPPLRGPHRPNWGKYGEYTYIPKQRWLHNLEHGSVVMLYEPCTASALVDAVRKMVDGCLYRHIITPYKGLGQDYPINLLTWGAKLQIAQVDEKAIVAFIKQHALHGPEQTSQNGIYDTLLIQPSQVVKGSDINDDLLCPGM